MTIMVVDDEPDIRAIAAFSLRQVGGHRVIEARSGAEAISLARSPEYRPDVILLDMMMPGLDGPTSLRLLREAPETAFIPVIFVTAKALPSDHEQGYGAGVRGIILKPFDPMQLPAQVQRMCMAIPGAPAVIRDSACIEGPAYDEAEQLADGYRGRLPLRVAEVLDALQRAAAGQPGERERALQLVHRMHGTAGSYEFHLLSRAAAHVEEQLRELVSAASPLSGHDQVRLGRVLFTALEQEAPGSSERVDELLARSPWNANAET